MQQNQKILQTQVALTSSDSSVSSDEGKITETVGSGIVAGSQEDLIVNVGTEFSLIMTVQI